MVGSAEQMEYKSHVVQRQLIGCALGKICKQTKNLLLVLYVIGPCLVRFKWTLIFLRSSHRIPFARAPGRVGCACAQHRQYTYRSVGVHSREHPILGAGTDSWYRRTWLRQRATTATLPIGVFAKEAINGDEM